MSRRLPRQALMGFAAIGLLIPCAAPAQGDPPIESFTEVAKTQSSVVMMLSGTPGGPSALSWSARCQDTSPRRGLVALSWQPGALRGSAQRVELTKFREGFDVNRFEVTRNLDPDLQAISVDGPEPGIHYKWRVLTETPSGWIPSAVGRFEAPTCPSDGAAFDNHEGGSR